MVTNETKTKPRITVQNRYLAFTALIVTLFNTGMIIGLQFKVDAIKDSTVEVTKAAETEIKPLVDPSLIDAMISIESSGDPNAYNIRTGAVGLLQLKPIIYGKLCGLTKEQAFEPERNVACGSLFFAELLKKYKGNAEAALLHYNNGWRISNYEYSKKVLTEKRLTKTK